MSIYAELDEVALPFLTLDTEHIGHSGTVLIVCADPRMVAGANPPAPSRVQQLVTRIRTEPGRPYGLSPHVIAVTCPPRMVADNARQRQLVQQNIPVLAGASRIIIEAHNGCAELAHFYKGRIERLLRQGSQTPYFELQRQLLDRGIERFAGRVAALTKRSLIVEANYVDFDSGGSVVEVTNVRTVEVGRTAAATDQGWSTPEAV